MPFLQHRILLSTISLVALFASVWAAPAAASSLQLRYEAFVGVAHAGTITVQVDRSAQSYAVRGEARSKGLLEMLKDVRGWFGAKGLLSENGTPEAELYEYYQKDNSKERLITVAGDELRYVKNGEERPQQPAHPGLDLVTALWVLGDCAEMSEIHTGRSGYDFQLTSTEGDTCRFTVQERDEDEAPFELQLDYGERDGQRVPIKIRSTGGWAGRLVLVD